MKYTCIATLILLLAGCGTNTTTTEETDTVLTAADDLVGAWGTDLPTDSGTFRAAAIFTEGYMSMAIYHPDRKTFVSTSGGAWAAADGQLTTTLEFHTADSERIGNSMQVSYSVAGDTLRLGEEGHAWVRLDGGTPGALAGAWLITGRERDGELSRSVPGVRKTMKILSGTRFQWIAYNTQTGEFFGTGGGTYTTTDSVYTENIDFFSRDSSRVGASLKFEFKLDSGEWHHSGLSSKGDPIYEIWTPRSMLDQNVDNL